MTVEDATKFFQDNCYYEEKPSRAEAMRGTFDPGYLNYTLGKLQILKLRDDYKVQADSIAPRADAERQIEVERSALGVDLFGVVRIA